MEVEEITPEDMIQLKAVPQAEEPVKTKFKRQEVEEVRWLQQENFRMFSNLYHLVLPKGNKTLSRNREVSEGDPFSAFHILSIIQGNIL